ncbi:MAG: PepSY domain-containing protein [Gammaproteobacteria bacterium]
MLREQTILALVLSWYAYTASAPADTLQLADTIVTPDKGRVAGSPGVEDHEQIRRLKESGRIRSLESVLKEIRRDYPGRIIEIELDDDDGSYAYELELVDEQGIVWDLEIDARTGKLLEKKQDD